MDLIKDAYFGKSFMMIGDELPHCFNCEYCRANDGKGLHFHRLPTDINPLFERIPVAVNCFYGDPMLQLDNTIDLVRKLDEAHHNGPIIIITKGVIKDLPIEGVFRNVHIGVSTFGKCKNEVDGGDWERFCNNLEYLKNHRRYNWKFHIEFRPIINGINDSEECIESVMEMAQKYDVPVAYSGLQVSQGLAQRLKDKGIIFQPYDERGFGLKKFISKEVEERIQSIAYNNNVPIFKKTSCLISRLNHMPDYNAHYYRPNEVGCANCWNREQCRLIKDKHDSNFLFYDDKEYLDSVIPFEYELVYAQNHKCSLFENGLCKFPSNDCTHINGRLIKVNEKITTTDVRLIKWLTGYTVDADFVECPYISKKWEKK